MKPELASWARALLWVGLTVAIASAAALAVSGPGNRFGWWDYRVAFSVMRMAAWGGAAGVVLCVPAVIMAAASGTRRALALAVVGIVAGALTVALPWQFRQRAQKVPPIHDITTDTEHPPRFVAAVPLRKHAPNTLEYGGAELARAQKQGYPDITPLTLPVDPATAFDQCLRAARSQGWDIVAAVPAELRIEATDTTPFFGFKDDVVVRITPAGGGSRVDVRSVSRVGRSDLGKNAERIRAFLRALANPS